jgi:GT2 family glycosyltransferase
MFDQTMPDDPTPDEAAAVQSTPEVTAEVTPDQVDPYETSELTAPVEAPPVKTKPDRTKFVVSALIVSSNVKPQLLQCLRAFFATADVPVEAVVVDNASTDGSAAAVTDEFPQATVLREAANLGYGRAANIGLERVRGRFVLLLNPDVTMDPLAVGRLADFLLTRPDAGAVGPRILMPDGSLDPEARRSFPVPRSLFYRTVGLSRLFPNSPRFGSYNMGHVEESDVHEIDAGTATCLMLRMAAVDRIGYFDPRYFMSGEDIDLCYRMKLGGWKIFYLPSATAARHETQPTSEVQRRARYQKYRSMWAFHFKHHAEDVPAFGNGLVWAQIWGRWAAQTLKDAVTKGRRQSS